MSSIEHLFNNNEKWAQEVKDDNPDFFTHLSEQQHPKYLWIGCSDSRVPANSLLGLAPGEVFVHRNIANLVIHSDLNCLSVIQYAVDILKVEHIIVCGHYGCGGISAAMDDNSYGLIDNWLNHIKDIYRFHQEKLDGINDLTEQTNLMCELNVIEQVANVSNCTTLKRAWASGQKVTIHGFIYKLRDGILRDLKVSINEQTR